jgi:hypothetical protein
MNITIVEGDNYLYTATIMFNESIIFDTNWNISDIDVYVDGPKTPYNMTWTLLGSDFMKISPSSSV